jgi:PAS domain S-box-containing protein
MATSNPTSTPHFHTSFCDSPDVSHEWIGTIFDNSPLGILRVNLNLEITYANPAMMEIAGLTDWTGKKVQDLIVDNTNLELVKERFANRRRGLSEQYEAEIVRIDDGRRAAVTIAAMPLFNTSGDVVGAISIIRSIAVEKAIQAFDQHLERCSTAADVLREIAQLAERLIAYDYCAASSYSTDLKRARVLFSHAPNVDYSSRMKWHDLGHAQADLLAQKKATIINDLPSYFQDRGVDEVLDRSAVRFLRQGFHSLIRYPVFREGRLVASYSFCSVKPNAFNEEHLRIVQALPIDAALITALHYEETAELRFRFELLKDLVDCRSNRKLSGLLVKRISAHYGWMNVGIFDVDEFTQTIRLNSQKALSRQFRMPNNHTQRLDEGVVGYAYQSTSIVNIRNVSEDETFKTVFIRTCPSTVSELCMPIWMDGKIVSLLNIEDAQENAFSPEEVESLRVLLNEAGVVFERIRADNLHSAAFKATPSAVLFVDRTGVIRRSNPAASKLLGYETPLEGKQLVDLFQDQSFGRAFVAAENPASREVTLLRADGSTVSVLMGGSQLGKDFEGDRVITAKDLYVQIRSAQTKFLGQMYYEIATQYKTPLSLVFNWLQMLQQQCTDDPVRDLLDKSLRQLSNIDLTFDRLALFDKSRPGPVFTPSLVDLKNLVTAVRDEFPTVESRRIRLNGFHGGESILIRGDTFQLSFVFKTLLSYFLRCSSSEEDITLDCFGEDGFLVLIAAGPWTALTATNEGRRASDVSLTRVLWEMALGQEAIAAFMKNHQASFEEDVTEKGRRRYRLVFPVARGEDSL